MPRLSWQSCRIPPTESSLVMIMALMMGSSIISMSLGLGNFAGLSTSMASTADARDAITHAGRGGDEVQAEFAFQALLHDFHVQQAEEAAAETETESDGIFRLVDKTRRR